MQENTFYLRICKRLGIDVLLRHTSQSLKWMRRQPAGEVAFTIINVLVNVSTWCHSERQRSQDTRLFARNALVITDIFKEYLHVVKSLFCRRLKKRLSLYSKNTCILSGIKPRLYRYRWVSAEKLSMVYQ